jgi:hypothetical protein
MALPLLTAASLPSLLTHALKEGVFHSVYLLWNNGFISWTGECTFKTYMN